MACTFFGLSLNHTHDIGNEHRGITELPAQTGQNLTLCVCTVHNSMKTDSGWDRAIEN